MKPILPPVCGLGSLDGYVSGPRVPERLDEALRPRAQGGEGLAALTAEYHELLEEVRGMAWVEPVSPDAAERLAERKAIVERQINDVATEIAREEGAPQ